MSALPDVIDFLVTNVAAWLPTVEVVDGPYVTVPSGDFLTVADAPDVADPASSETGWDGNDGAYALSEAGSVVCYLDSFGGDTDAASVKGRRDSALAFLSTVEAQVKADPTFGGLLVGTGALVVSRIVRQVEGESGYEVGITFTVGYTTRI